MDAAGKSAADWFWHEGTTTKFTQVKKNPSSGLCTGPDPVLI